MTETLSPKKVLICDHTRFLYAKNVNGWIIALKKMYDENTQIKAGAKVVHIFFAKFEASSAFRADTFKKRM